MNFMKIIILLINFEISNSFLNQQIYPSQIFKAYESSCQWKASAQQNQKLGVFRANSANDIHDSKVSDHHSVETFQKQLELFYKMSLPFFRTEDGVGRNLLIGVIGLTLLNAGVSVAFSYIGRDFWTALSNKNPEEFYEMITKFGAALCAGVPVTVFYKYQRDKLALTWRDWMTRRIMEIYYANQTYYALEANRAIDNPDQRIAEDVKAFTRYSLDFLITLITALIDVVSFSSILFSIYPQLFGAILAYAGFGTVVTTQLGKKLIGLNFDQLQREADFRYSLMRVRENAESIAFYGGEELELKEITKRLGEVVTNFGDVIKSQRSLEFFTVSYRYLIQVIPGLVIAPLYFSNRIQLGVVSQSYGAFNHILSDLSIIVNQFEGLSSFSAGIDRLGQFLQRMSPNGDLSNLLHTSLASPSVQEMVGSRADIVIKGMDLDQIDVTIESGALLSAKNLTVQTPDGNRVLVSGVAFSLKPRQKLLIVGESGTGKSSFLRTLAGLWKGGTGSIVRPPPQEMFFLPQRPYCTLGSLRDQITYPQLPGDVKDEDLFDILKKVDLADLPARMGDGNPLQGLYSTKDWSGILSLGEQQRLGFGRILYNRPALAIMDEATSALDLGNEMKMYSLLVEQIPHISYVSVGHRPSLFEYHDSVLKIFEGGCCLEEVGSCNYSLEFCADLNSN